METQRNSRRNKGEEQVKKLLKVLANKYIELTDERKREIKNLEKFMKKFTFLFSTNMYTDAHEFSYSDKYKGKWFANIIYYPSSGTCLINTGTYHPEKQIIGKDVQFDKPPDINKLQRAIAITIDKMNENTEDNIKYMKNARNLLEGIKL